MPPVIPSATYRLQLTANFDFDAAAAIITRIISSPQRDILPLHSTSPD